jgi:hypothetical protein
MDRFHKRWKPTNVIFTGEACNYIRQRYTQIGELFRAMRYLGYRLRLDRDVIAISDGRVKVPAEAIHQHLASRAFREQRSTQPADGVGSESVTLDGEDVKSAGATFVLELAKKYRTVTAVATAAGIKRPTLIAAWKRAGVLEVWHKASRPMKK